MHEDTELLRRFAENRSNEAFSALVRRHLNLVYSSALRRTNGDTHLAEDVTQIVFVTLARQAASLRAHAVLAGWLYVATRNAAAKAMRTELRRTTREQEAYAMQESSFSSNATTDWDRIRPQLESVLDELDERDRDAVLLRFFENRPFAEIGDALRVSNDAARMRVDRALEKLRALLARRGITSTTAALALALEHQAAAAAPAGLAASVNSALIASGAMGGAGASSFMSTTILTVGVAGLVSLLSLGTALYQANQAREAEASRAALTASGKTNAARIQELEGRLVSTEKSKTLAEPLPLPPGKATNADSAAAEATKKKKAATALAFSEAMKDPVFAAAWRKQQLRYLEGAYGDAFTALNLSPDRLTRLKELLIARRESVADARDAARTAGLTDAELGKAVIQASNLWTNPITGVVGETGYAALERSEKAQPFRSMLDPIAVDLKMGGMPLTPEQATQLAFRIYEYLTGPEWIATGLRFQGIQSFTRAHEADPQTGLTPHSRALLERYAPHLTPAQLQVVKDYLLESVKWSQLNAKP